MRKSFKKALSVAIATSMVFSVPVAVNAANSPATNGSPSTNPSVNPSAGTDAVEVEVPVTTTTIDKFGAARTGEQEFKGNFNVTYNFYVKTTGTETYHNLVAEITDGTTFLTCRGDNAGWWWPNEAGTIKWEKEKLDATSEAKLKSELKAGAKAKVNIVRKGNTIVETFTVGSQTFKCTATSAKLGATVKVYITGEKCIISKDAFKTESNNGGTTDKPVVKPTVKPAVKMSLSKYTVSVKKGAKATVSVKTLVPSNAKVTVSSSKKSVATVKYSRKKVAITGVKKGTATVTVKAAASGKTSAVKKITVRVTEVPNKKLTIASKAKVEKGGKLTLKPVTTKGTTDKVTYKTSKKSVATVSSKGVVVGKKLGTAKITVTCGKVKKTVKVTVVNKNKKLVLAKRSVQVKKGKKVTVKATTSKKTVPVKVSVAKKYSKVISASVKSNKITVKGKKKGNGKVTVVCGSKKATLAVKVK